MQTQVFERIAREKKFGENVDGRGLITFSLIVDGLIQAISEIIEALLKVANGEIGLMEVELE